MKNLDFLMGEVYDGVYGKEWIPELQLVLSGVLRRRDVCVMEAYWGSK
jgi:hypothetical protein